MRKGVKTATAAKFDVKERDAGGHLRSGGRFRPERHNLAVWGRWGTGRASAMSTVFAFTASPVGTMLSNTINTVNPRRV